MFNRVAANARSMVIAVARVAPVLFRDAAGIAATGLISYGAWLIYPPAGFISAGVLILAGVILLSARA